MVEQRCSPEEIFSFMIWNRHFHDRKG
jgi:hypothetical protein